MDLGMLKCCSSVSIQKTQPDKVGYLISITQIIKSKNGIMALYCRNLPMSYLNMKPIKLQGAVRTSLLSIHHFIQLVPRAVVQCQSAYRLYYSSILRGYQGTMQLHAHQLKLYYTFGTNRKIQTSTAAHQLSFLDRQPINGQPTNRQPINGLSRRNLLLTGPMKISFTLTRERDDRSDVHACMCACVCVKERGRERERKDKDKFFLQRQK